VPFAPSCDAAGEVLPFVARTGSDADGRGELVPVPVVYRSCVAGSCKRRGCIRWGKKKEFLPRKLTTI